MFARKGSTVCSMHSIHDSAIPDQLQTRRRLMREESYWQGTNMWREEASPGIVSAPIDAWPSLAATK
jgi:hypothetical protein